MPPRHDCVAQLAEPGPLKPCECGFKSRRSRFRLRMKNPGNESSETFNDRTNWQHVRDVDGEGSSMWDWTRVFEDGETELWSAYAVDLYTRNHDNAVAEGCRWLRRPCG